MNIHQSSKGNVGELHQCLPFVSFQIGTHSYMIFLCAGGVYNVNYHQSPRLFWYVILMNLDIWYFPNLWRNKKAITSCQLVCWQWYTCICIVYFQSVLISKKWHLIWDLANQTIGLFKLIQHTYLQVHGVPSLHWLLMHEPTSSNLNHPSMGPAPWSILVHLFFKFPELQFYPYIKIFTTSPL